MPQEIERKFLVNGDFKPYAKKAFRIAQGYLSASSGCTVRVRTKGEKAFLTIKGPSLDGGISRYEWEKEIVPADALDLLKLCRTGIIDKTRYLVDVGSHTFEVDEFHGENKGLVIAEVELSDAAEDFEKPSWLGIEVTGDIRYYNSYIAANSTRHDKEQ